jgi:hypothetical protein
MEWCKEVQEDSLQNQRNLDVSKGTIIKITNNKPRRNNKYSIVITNMPSLRCIMSWAKERTNIYLFKIIICILGMLINSLTYTCEGKLIFVIECASAYKNWENISTPFQHSRLIRPMQIASAQLRSINIIYYKHLKQLNPTFQQRS